MSERESPSLLLEQRSKDDFKADAWLCSKQGMWGKLAYLMYLSGFVLLVALIAFMWLAYHLEDVCLQSSLIGKNTFCSFAAKFVEGVSWKPRTMFSLDGALSLNESLTSTTCSSVGCSTSSHSVDNYCSILGCSSGNGTIISTFVSSHVENGNKTVQVDSILEFQVGDTVLICTNPIQSHRITSINDTRIIGYINTWGTRRLGPSGFLTFDDEVDPAIPSDVPVLANAHQHTTQAAALGVGIGTAHDTRTTTTYDTSKWWPHWAWWVLVILCVFFFLLLGISATAAAVCMKKSGGKTRAVPAMGTALQMARFPRTDSADSSATTDSAASSIEYMFEPTTTVVTTPEANRTTMTAAAARLFDQLDYNRDGVIDRREWEANALFSQLDRNGDGFIDRSEWNAAGLQFARAAPAMTPPGDMRTCSMSFSGFS